MTLLIFDCDGVLIDSEFLHGKIESAIGRELFGIDRDYIEHNRLFLGRGMKMVYETWRTEYGKPLPDDIEKIMEHRKNEAFSNKLTAVPYVAEALDGLIDLPKCVASGSPMSTLDFSLNMTGLSKYFGKNIYSADVVKHGKPAPDIFLYAATKMNAEPKDCIVIEDSIAGVNAALAAGMRVIGFTGGGHCAPDHAEKLVGAKPIIGDMRELPTVIKSMI